MGDRERKADDETNESRNQSLILMVTMKILSLTRDKTIILIKDWQNDYIFY